MFAWLLLLLLAESVKGLNEFRTWSDKSICDKVQNVNYPFAYSKYALQNVESKGRVNSNLQDFRHECQTLGGRSKCHICETISCGSDIGTCELQLQGVDTNEMSVNIPTVSDIAWAVGGRHRSDYGGDNVSHYCVFISRGNCVLHTTTDFSGCAIRCFGYNSPGPMNYSVPEPIVVEPAWTPVVDIPPADRWSYPRNCSDIEMSGRVCKYIDGTASHTPIPSFNPQGFTFTAAGSGSPGFVDGPSKDAEFYLPGDVTVDELGFIYVADTGNNAIRLLSPDGWVSTIAGQGPTKSGFIDGNCSIALFSQPKGIDVMRNGSMIILIVADTGNHRLRRVNIDNSSKTCEVTCLSGLCFDPAAATNPYYNQITPLAGYTDGAANIARYSSPQDVAIMFLQNDIHVVVADTSNFLIRFVNLTSGNVSTLAGNIEVDTSDTPIEGCLSPCMVGVAGKRDGSLTYAQFYTPQSISIGANNTIFVADEHRIRIVELPGLVTEYYEVLSQGRVSTIAGTSLQGDEDGRGEESTFFNPAGVFVTADNIAYVSDAATCHIRRITPLPISAQPITCGARAVDIIRPSGCTSYDQTIDKTNRKISRVESNVIYNYGPPYQNDPDRGRHIKNCVGSPPPQTLDKMFLDATGTNLAVDDYQSVVNEDAEIGSSLLVSCPSNCSSSIIAIVEGSGIYSDTSSICRAAIHNGVIDNSGGIILVTIGSVNESFAQTLVGTTSSEITSLSLPIGEQRTFTTESYKTSIHIVHTVCGHPAARLQDGCGYYDSQPSTLSLLNSPLGLSAIKNSTITDKNFLYIADSANNIIRGVSASCTQICENGGRCIGPDMCSCSEGWSGVDCTRPTCTVPCGINNVCVGPNMCECKPGYSGPDCNIPLCVQTCQNGGSCTAPDSCVCSPGWFDSNCTTPVCSQTCGNGGNCTAPSICSCPSEWSGFDCRIPVCKLPCLNGALCVAPDTCQCPPQWIGKSCDIPVCSQGFFVSNDQYLITHQYSTNSLKRNVYKPCDLTLWCEATKEFECDQTDLLYEEATVLSGPSSRGITGRKEKPSKCMKIELPLQYKIPYSLETDKNLSTGFMRYSPFTPYESNALNQWRGYEYDASHIGHTGPWSYSSDRQIALVEYLSVTEGVYVCANKGNCSSPDVCICAPGWIGFDCRTPVCTQGFYHPDQINFISGLETSTEVNNFKDYLHNAVKLQWPYSNPQYGVEFESYADVSTVIRSIQQLGGVGYLGKSSTNDPSNQGGYRCSIRSVTQWENLNYIFDHPNYFSRYMDMTIQFDGNTYSHWNNMFWPPVHSKSKKLDQVIFGITFAYTDEGFRRLGVWSKRFGIQWQYGTCILEFRRNCSKVMKSLDLTSDLSLVTVQDTDLSFRARISYSDFNVTSKGRWNAEGGECVDLVLRGCFNNGTCTAPNTCVCASGWSSFDCSVPLCSQKCLHNGNCTLPNICTCEKGWTGYDCSIALCAQECQNGGKCVAPDTCQCEQWENDFRDGRLGGGRPLYRKGNGDPQYTGWTGFDCSIPICVQAQAFIQNVGSDSSIGYQVLGGHGGDNLLSCTSSLGLPLPRCPQYDKKVTSNDGRSFYTGCGYDPIDTGCCIAIDSVSFNCYKCPSDAIIIDTHSLSCNVNPYKVTLTRLNKESHMQFLDSNKNFKMCGKYHVPRRFTDSIRLTDYGEAVYFRSTIFRDDERYSSRNFLSNLTSDRFLCGREYWTQGDYIDDAGLSVIFGAGTHYGLRPGRNIRSNNPNYYMSAVDITGSLYHEGPEISGEGIFECFNHGSCLGPDFCSCSDGWSGIDCSIPLCRHLQPSGIISGCLNGGICGNKDDCTCIQTSSILWEIYSDAVKGLTGWSGTDCSIPICSQGYFDPFCTDLPQAPAGEGCYRCSNGGNCTAPDLCTCAEGWTGYDCKTPVCEVVADPLTRTQLRTVYEDKIVDFESDPCGVESIYGRELWKGLEYARGNCTLPNQCTCFCKLPYDPTLCKNSYMTPMESYDYCRGAVAR